MHDAIEISTAYRELSEPAYHDDFVTRYDQVRPSPPADLIALLAG